MTVACIALLFALAEPPVHVEQRPQLPRPGQSPGVELSFDRELGIVAPGESKLVTVLVSGIPDSGLAAFQFTVHYDPAVVEIVDPNGAYTSSGVPTFAPLGASPLCAAIRERPSCPDPEWLLAATGRQPLGTSRPEHARGRVTVAFGTSGDAPGATGDGALAVLRVIGTGGGKPELRLTGAILADASDPPRRYAIRGGGE